MKILESDNFKAFLIYLLICLGITTTVGIVVKLFTPKPLPPVTTINQYFVNNKEITQYGIPKQLNGY